MKTREEYIDRIKTKLDELNAHIESMEHKAYSKKAKAEAEWHSYVNELKGKRQDLERTAKELRNASEDGWKSAKQGADKVLEDASKTFKKIEERLAAAVS